MTLLSIIIPAYNVEKYIKKTIKSVLSQNSKEIEIIVVDDGSTDNTYKIAYTLLKNRKNAKIIRKKNGGVSSARNTGLKHAKGKYVMFLDGDDFVSKDFFKEIKKNLDYKYDIVFWKFDEIDEKGKILLRYESEYNCNGLDENTGIEVLKKIIIEKTCWIWTGCAVYNREFLIKNKLKYTEGCINGEDLEFIFKSLTKAKKTKFINKTLSYYLIRENSTIWSYNIKKLDNLLAFFRVLDFFKKNKVPKEIIKHFKYDIIPRHFIVTTTILMIYSMISKKDFFSDLEKNYRGLLNKIKPYLKKYIGRETMIKINIKLFLISPKFYFFILKLIGPRRYLWAVRTYMKLKSHSKKSN